MNRSRKKPIVIMANVFSSVRMASGPFSIVDQLRKGFMVRKITKKAPKIILNAA
jgi:hypothetical protein